MDSSGSKKTRDFIGGRHLIAKQGILCKMGVYERIVIHGVINNPYKWPKINGFLWGYFTPISGVKRAPTYNWFFGPTLWYLLVKLMPFSSKPTVDPEVYKWMANILGNGKLAKISTFSTGNLLFVYW